ncbi:MAG: hypothetical protein N2445_07645 [Acidobacteria bacterium]|nr:hypothetical protein [Acidobacteriota bacterium]
MVCFSQIQPLELFKRDLSIDPISHTASAIQTNTLTKENYNILLKTFPYDDGDTGVEYDSQGNLKSWFPLKISFSVTKFDLNTNCYISLEKVIKVVLDFKSNQLKIENIPDLNDLIDFSRNTSIEEEVATFLTTIKQYFPYKVTPNTLGAALSGISNFFQEKYQTFADPTGGVVAVAIIAVICIWECPIIVGCAIGAGGFNIYWAQCVGVAPST